MVFFLNFQIFVLVGFLSLASIYILWLFFFTRIASNLHTTSPVDGFSLMCSKPVHSSTPNDNHPVHNHAPDSSKPSSSITLNCVDPSSCSPPLFPPSMPFSTFSKGLRFGVEGKHSTGFPSVGYPPVLPLQLSYSVAPS